MKEFENHILLVAKLTHIILGTFFMHRNLEKIPFTLSLRNCQKSANQILKNSWFVLVHPFNTADLASDMADSIVGVKCIVFMNGYTRGNLYLVPSKRWISGQIV